MSSENVLEKQYLEKSHDLESAFSDEDFSKKFNEQLKSQLMPEVALTTKLPAFVDLLNGNKKSVQIPKGTRVLLSKEPCRAGSQEHYRIFLVTPMTFNTNVEQSSELPYDSNYNTTTNLNTYKSVCVSSELIKSEYKQLELTGGWDQQAKHLGVAGPTFVVREAKSARVHCPKFDSNFKVQSWATYGIRSEAGFDLQLIQSSDENKKRVAGLTDRDFKVESLCKKYQMQPVRGLNGLNSAPVCCAYPAEVYPLLAGQVGSETFLPKAIPYDPQTGKPIFAPTHGDAHDGPSPTPQQIVEAPVADPLDKTISEDPKAPHMEILKLIKARKAKKKTPLAFPRKWLDGKPIKIDTSTLGKTLRERTANHDMTFIALSDRCKSGVIQFGDTMCMATSFGYGKSAPNKVYSTTRSGTSCYYVPDSSFKGSTPINPPSTYNVALGPKRLEAKAKFGSTNIAYLQPEQPVPGRSALLVHAGRETWSNAKPRELESRGTEGCIRLDPACQKEFNAYLQKNGGNAKLHVKEVKSSHKEKGKEFAAENEAKSFVDDQYLFCNIFRSELLEDCPY